MNLFISYSHNDHAALDKMHKHLKQLQRDGLISTWTDADILAGGNLDKDIDSALHKTNVFVALLSPDYIASNYCYEKEFEKALKMQEEGSLIIVPVIIEPCDWLNTPFNKFKALPKDGKAISTWENINTAFLDVIQNLRRLVSGITETDGIRIINAPSFSAKNYRVQKDFDSIERLEFVERTFKEVKEFIIRFKDEIIQLDNIKARVLTDSEITFECLLINRNMISTESKLFMTIDNANRHSGVLRKSENELIYRIGANHQQNSFSLSNDKYHLFWELNTYFRTPSGNKELDAKDIAEIIWDEWLESVGIDVN